MKIEKSIIDCPICKKKGKIIKFQKFVVDIPNINLNLYKCCNYNGCGAEFNVSYQH